MKRTGFIARRVKPHPKAPPPVAKNLGRSAVSKKPWKSKAYRAWVISHPCLMTPGWYGACLGETDPHHCRKLLPHQLLPRDDRFCVPLCRAHHDMAHYGRVIEPAYWEPTGDAHLRFIRSSPEGAAAIADLAKERLT